MPKQQPIEIFMPPNVLKAKVGGSGGIDLSAIKRAEQAIDDLKEEFIGWIAQDVERLGAMRDLFAASPGPETFGGLYRAAHDLKGQGTTFDFPLVARVASSLCNLTDAAPAGAALPLALIDAHVDGIKVILREKIKNAADPIASVLAAELERKVANYLEKHTAR